MEVVAEGGEGGEGVEGGGWEALTAGVAGGCVGGEEAGDMISALRF